MSLEQGQNVLSSERKIELEWYLFHFLMAFILPTPYRCSTGIWKRNQSDSGTQNVIKKLRLSKPVGGGRPVVFPTRDTDGRKEIGERKTDRDRQDDQERQREIREIHQEQNAVSFYCASWWKFKFNICKWWVTHRLFLRQWFSTHNCTLEQLRHANLY